MTTAAPVGLVTVIKAAVGSSRVYNVTMVLSPVGVRNRFSVVAGLAFLNGRFNLSVTSVFKTDTGKRQGLVSLLEFFVVNQPFVTFEAVLFVSYGAGVNAVGDQRNAGVGLG
jgi:hypothetical protein